jgi:anti-anti-sigma regulatory factor
MTYNGKNGSATHFGAGAAEPTMFSVQIFDRDGYRIPVLRVGERALSYYIVEITGKVSCKALEEEFRDFCRSRCKELVRAPADRMPCVFVDLQDVPCMDETGLGTLVRLYRENCGCLDFAVVFVAPTRHMSIAIDLCKIDKILLLYPDVETAFTEIRQHAKPRTVEEWRITMKLLSASAAGIKQMVAERGPSGSEPRTFDLQLKGDGVYGIHRLRLRGEDRKCKAELRADLQDFVIPLVASAAIGDTGPCPCVIIDSEGMTPQWLVAEVLLGFMIERSVFWVVAFVGNASRIASQSTMSMMDYTGVSYPDEAAAVAQIRRHPRPRTREEYFKLMECLFEDVRKD